MVRKLLSHLITFTVVVLVWGVVVCLLSTLTFSVTDKIQGSSSSGEHFIEIRLPPSPTASFCIYADDKLALSTNSNWNTHRDEFITCGKGCFYESLDEVIEDIDEDKKVAGMEIIYMSSDIKYTRLLFVGKRYSSMLDARHSVQFGTIFEDKVELLPAVHSIQECFRVKNKFNQLVIYMKLKETSWDDAI